MSPKTSLIILTLLMIGAFFSTMYYFNNQAAKKRQLIATTDQTNVQTNDQDDVSTSSPPIQTTPASVSTTAPSAKPAVSADKVTNSFYTEYLGCIHSQAQGSNQDCSKINSQYLTTSAMQKVAAANGYDGVLCAQSSPLNIKVPSIPDPNSTTATIKVSEDFGGSPQQISVTLILVNNAWKVDGITCPF